MKKYLFALFAFSIIACTSCQENIDFAQEEEAIKNVIQTEVDLWLAQDYITESEFVKQADYVLAVNNNGNFHNQIVGYDSIFALLKESAEMDWSEFTNSKIECRDFHIKVYDDIAWAVYYAQLTGEWKGEPVDFSDTRVTVLERVDGNWKIVLNSITGLNRCEEDKEDDEDDE